jgi:hypothetical protein
MVRMALFLCTHGEQKRMQDGIKCDGGAKKKSASMVGKGPGGEGEAVREHP